MTRRIRIASARFFVLLFLVVCFVKMVAINSRRCQNKEGEVITQKAYNTCDTGLLFLFF